MTDMPVFLVRLKAGPFVPESARVTHIVPGDQMAPAVMVPYCGIVLRQGTVDPPLAGLQGAPCEACCRIAPIPGNEEAPALPKREPGRHLSEALGELVTTAVEALTVHCDRDGHCPIHGGDSACERAVLASHNLELLH